nr:hypothetical protein [Mucilaginibacter sp. SP1R1]
MKLFYHFLIFVFVSLLLVACANIFNTDNKIQNDGPSWLEHSFNQNDSDSSIKVNGKNSPYVRAGLNDELLKGKALINDQFNYTYNIYLKNI